MIFEKDFRARGFDSLVAYSAKDITDKMIDECYELSNKFFPDEYASDGPEIKDVIREFGNFCLVIYNKENKKLVGFSFWIPIKTAVFNEFLKNKKMLLFIKREYCSSFDEPKINLFSASEAFVAGYDLENIHKALEDIFQGKVLALAKKGTKVSFIAIEAVCKYDEEYLVKQLGMIHKIQKEDSTFYCEPYDPTKVYSRSRFVQELKEYYKKR